jgi:hypothetical protein
MTLRRQMLTLMLIACGTAAWAADALTAQLQEAPGRTVPSLAKPAAPLDQQVAALQQQVAALQSQVNALMAAVRVSETGVVLQGRSVTIAGQSVDIRSDLNLGLRADALTGDFMQTATLRTAGALTVASSGTLDLRASTIRLNNGSKPIATAGSLVQMQSTGTGQIVNGSATVLAD